MIKLSKFAKDLGVTKMTLWNWKKQGKLDFIKIGSMNYVDVETYNKFLGIQESKKDSTVIYCRVSSSQNKDSLERQKERLLSYCAAKGYSISKVVTEIGSGINDQRPKLLKLLSEQDFTRLVVEHKDRLTRFGFSYIETLLKERSINIEVINSSNDSYAKDDLVEDFVSIIASYCARIYGKRRSKRQTEKIIEQISK